MEARFQGYLRTSDWGDQPLDPERAHLHNPAINPQFRNSGTHNTDKQEIELQERGCTKLSKRTHRILWRTYFWENTTDHYRCLKINILLLAFVDKEVF